MSGVNNLPQVPASPNTPALIKHVNDRLRRITTALNAVQTGVPGKAGAAGPPGLAGTPGLSATYQRTLTVRDTTIANNCGPNPTVFIAGTAQNMTGVLRLAIAADLTVRLNLVIAGVSTPLITGTIPAATAVSTVLTFTVFAIGATLAMPLDAVLIPDVVASDGSIDPGGVASFTLVWK
jgi:hypothetical protein